MIITGLKMNFTESTVVLINLSEREGADIAEILGCLIASFPQILFGDTTLG
jgi:hypothetical protein